MEMSLDGREIKRDEASTGDDYDILSYISPIS